MGGCLPDSRVSASLEDFIRTRLVLEPVRLRPDISLHRPTPRSGLTGFLAEHDCADEPPYWAYMWAGGVALALYLRDHPERVAGRNVLDFGAGSGLVGIAAAKAGAGRVLAFEPDPLGRIALRFNAEANEVEIGLSDAVEKPDIVLAGDVFYDAEVAASTLPVLSAYAANGANVLVGDPFRAALPLSVLEQIAEYAVPDMGSGALVQAGVFALRG
jgi:predicted nicotinamide N-methyase